MELIVLNVIMQHISDNQAQPARAHEKQILPDQTDLLQLGDLPSCHGFIVFHQYSTFWHNAVECELKS